MKTRLFRCMLRWSHGDTGEPCERPAWEIPGTGLCADKIGAAWTVSHLASGMSLMIVACRRAVIERVLVDLAGQVDWRMSAEEISLRFEEYWAAQRITARRADFWDLLDEKLSP